MLQVKTFNNPMGYAQFIENNQHIEIISVNTISEFAKSGRMNFNAEKIMLTFRE